MAAQHKLKEVLFWTLTGGAFLLMIYNTVLYYRLQNSNRPTILPAEETVEIEPGTALEQVNLRMLNGESFSLPTKGRYLIAFLTTGCGPCQTQVQYLNKAAKLPNYDKVLAIFFEPQTAVAEFQSQFQPEFLCLRDDTGRLNDRLRLRSFPQSVDLRDGVVAQSWIGTQERFE